MRGGDKEITLPCKPIDEVLKGSFDIAKFDCEGCEKYLAEVDELKIPRWIIEVHSLKTLKNLVKHFSDRGYNVLTKPYIKNVYIMLASVYRDFLIY